MKFRKLDKAFLASHVGDFVSLITGWEFSSWQASNFLYELPKKWDFSFSVYDEGDLLAFCIASNKIQDAYYIHLIFISQAARGKKLGKQMIEHAKSIAMENGIRKIELRCPETNTSALEFYRHAGFKEIARLKDEISGDVADYYFQLSF